MSPRIAIFSSIAILFIGPASAQDIRGLEVCTAEKQMERRTGCLQSNVEFLQQTIRKNATDAQQKITAAHAQAAAVHAQLAAAGKEIAALKDALAKMEKRLGELEKKEKK